MEQEVNIHRAAGDLFGTLNYPSELSNFPVALFISGSGPTDRNGNSGGSAGKSDCLKQLSEALVEHGIGSLRFDKQGVGKSPLSVASESDLRIETYLQDAMAWMDFLRKRYHQQKIFVIGHSEGALLGILLAQEMKY